ncbi:MAG: sugar phosphate isomerase/epimerase [Verrucomicrobia bacterium]|nr:sugar phosphate isomerase/epimerase [Verrucomicrobiota bacterium]
MNTLLSNRRTFLKSTTATAGLALAGVTATAAESAPRRGIKLGFDNFSIRAMGWKAPQLLDYAAAQKVDVLLMSDLDVYENFTDAHLADIKRKADDLGILIHAGSWSICPTSKAFRNKWGTAEEHLRLIIRVAKALGSPVARCVLGTGADRATEGGIEARIADTVKVLKACRTQALDAGVKVAIENHAGDMQAWELVTLIEAAGKDFVGALMDAGNSTWTMEDPLTALEQLGPYAVSAGVRDSAIWETPDGATVQWTAIGDGNVDFKTYTNRFAELCPKCPFVLEIITGFPREFTYLKEGFWKNYPKARASDLAKFIALAKKGKPIEAWKAPPGVDKRPAEQEYQKTHLEKSLRYCKEVLGLGLK